MSRGNSQLHLTHAGDVVRRDQESSHSGLHRTAFQIVLPGAPPAHYMVAGKAADPNAEAFADFVSQMMSFNGGENTKTDTSLQATAKLVLCPVDEPPHALCSRSTCSFSAQGKPRAASKGEKPQLKRKTAMKRYFGPLKEPENAFARNNCWKSPAVHAHHYHY